jgi:predicted Zn-dependent protease with MMP-like domain
MILHSTGLSNARNENLPRNNTTSTSQSFNYKANPPPSSRLSGNDTSIPSVDKSIAKTVPSQDYALQAKAIQAEMDSEAAAMEDTNKILKNLLKDSVPKSKMKTEKVAGGAVTDKAVAGNTATTVAQFVTENTLEDQYSLTSGENDPVKISVNGNTITVDVYVNFTGDKDTEIFDSSGTNGETARSLAIAGIKAWAGEYTDVYGHDVEVIVNINEGKKSFWSFLPGVSSQNYYKINLNNGVGRANRNYKWYANDAATPYTGSIDMYSYNLNSTARSKEDYRQTITHEMGHVFGLDDGYKDIESNRPEASMQPEKSVMRNNHQANAITTKYDIQMILEAARTGEKQYYMDYKQILSYGKEKQRTQSVGAK